MKKSAFYLWMITLAVTAACSRGEFYRENIVFREGYWLENEKIQFDITVTGPGDTYQMSYSIRNGLDYPYRNLYIQYTIQDSAGNSIREDLQRMALFHPKTGKPYGKGSIGNMYEHEILALENFRFPYSGIFSIQLQQFMRVDTLQDIVSVGIILEKESTE